MTALSWGALLITFVITLVVYISTASPSVGGGDSGELMCAAHDGVVAHPPGYPTFVKTYSFCSNIITRVGKLVFVDDGFLFLKRLFTTTEGACNVVSCILSAIAAGLLAQVGAVLAGGDAAAGICGALIAAFSPTVWAYAAQTEVFAMHNLFVAVLLSILVEYELSRARRTSASKESVWVLPFIRSNDAESPIRVALLGAFWCGIALTNQHTAVLLVVPIAVWVVFFGEFNSLLQKPISFTIACVFWVLCGLSVYLTMMFQSASSSTSSSMAAWGNTSTWEGFWHHFLRRDYGTLSLGSKEANYLVKASSSSLLTWKLFFADVPVQFRTIWTAAPVVGLIALLLNRGPGVVDNNNNNAITADQLKTVQRRVTIAIVLSWLCYTIFFHALSNLPIDQPLFLGVQKRFWMHPFLLVSVFSAPGLSLVARLVSPKATVAFLAVIAAQISVVYKQQDESHNDYIEQFGKAMLRMLPKDAMLLTKGDLVINSVRFVQTIQKFRPDVVVLDQEMMTYSWYVTRAKAFFQEAGVVFPGARYFPHERGSFDMAALLKANKKRRAFVAYGVKEGDSSVKRDGMELRPFGFADEIVTQKALAQPRDMSTRDALRYIKELMISFGKPNSIRVPDVALRNKTDRVYDQSTWEAIAAGDLAAAMQRVAFMLHRVVDFQKTQHAELLGMTLEDPTDDSAKARRATLPATTWTMRDLKTMCEKTALVDVYDGDDATTAATTTRTPSRVKFDASNRNANMKKTKASNRKASTNSNAIDGDDEDAQRTTLMCALHYADSMLSECITRFPSTVSSALFRNRAAIMQSMAAFSLRDAKVMDEINALLVDSLERYVKLAPKEKGVNKKDLDNMKHALNHFKKELKK